LSSFTPPITILVNSSSSALSKRLENKHALTHHCRTLSSFGCVQEITRGVTRQSNILSSHADIDSDKYIVSLKYCAANDCVKTPLQRVSSGWYPHRKITFGWLGISWCLGWETIPQTYGLDLHQMTISLSYQELPRSHTSTPWTCCTPAMTQLITCPCAIHATKETAPMIREPLG
jgi:hypothetical protein